MRVDHVPFLPFPSYSKVPNYPRSLDMNPPSNVHRASLRRMCYIQDLSQDTLLRIFLELGAFDIFVLRQCSKRMYAATRERTVWIKFLRRFCWEHSICIGVFPIDRMPTQQMEHIVSSPPRFHRRLLHRLSSEHALEPVSTRVLARSDSQTCPVINDVKLMAGGRFLIGVVADHREMHLWDLGFTPSAEPLPEPMVSKRMNGRIQDVLVQPTADSLGVLFLVITKTDLLPTQSLLEVYEMYPDSAVLHRLASWSLSGEPLKQVHSTVYFAGSYVIMGYPARDGGGEILVWNYADNTAAKWDIDFVNENDEFSIHDGHVILVGEDSITVWKIPRLHARIPGVDVHREHNLPSASIEHGGFRTLHAAYRQPNSLKGFHVDVFADAVADRMCRLKRYVVTAPSGVEENPLVNPREPSIFPILLGESPIPPEDQSDDDHYFSTWLSDQEIVIFRSEHERWLVRANAIAQPSPFGYPKEKAAYGMLSLGSPPDKPAVGGLIQTPSCASSTLCPATGRACVVDGNDIRILDYLSP